MSPPRAGLLRILILLAFVMAGAAPKASAQVATPPATPPTPPAVGGFTGAGLNQQLKESFTEASLPIVKTFVQTQATALAGEDDAERSRARDLLINEATIIGGHQRVSASYLDAYAAAVNDALAPLAQSPNLKVRVNAAIVAAKVARLADNSRLAGTVLLLLADKSDAVALWAMKAAHAVLPAVLRQPGFGPNAPGTKLLAAIVPTVQMHPAGPVAGSVAEEAYAALTLDIRDPNKRRKLTGAMLTAVIPDIHRLMAHRNSEYIKGIPPRPFAESMAAGFLSQGDVLAIETPAQKLQSMQLLSDLIHLIAQQVGNVDGDAREELNTMLKNAAAGISVANANDAALVAALKPAAVDLNVKADAPMVAAAIQPILPALQKTYPTLKAPPAIQVAAVPVVEEDPTTQATTQSTTRPTTRATTRPIPPPATAAAK